MHSDKMSTIYSVYSIADSYIAPTMNFFAPLSPRLYICASALFEEVCKLDLKSVIVL